MKLAKSTPGSPNRDPFYENGRKYITVFVDIDMHKVIFVTEGKDSVTFGEFAENSKAHGSEPQNIKEIVMGMSPVF
jgi:transposase